MCNERIGALVNAYTNLVLAFLFMFVSDFFSSGMFFIVT